MIKTLVTNRWACCYIMLALFLAASMPVTSMAADAGASKGKVWRVWNARVDESKLSIYKRYLVKVYQAKLDAWEEAGLITDYKILESEPKSATDANIVFMFQYKNMAALDVPEEAWEKVADKVMEKFKNDKEVMKMEADYHLWRTFIGWSPISRELIWK